VLADSPSSLKALRLEQHQSQVFDAQLQFNLFPATYAHPSWIVHAGLCRSEAELRELPIHSPYWIRSVSDTLLGDLDLHQQYDFDFSDSTKRIALLDAASLTHVGNHVAAVLLRNRLRTLVLKSDVERISQTVGAAARRFALEGTHEVPPVPSHALVAAASVPESWPETLARLIVGCVPEAACGIRTRLQMRFPHAWLAQERRRALFSEAEHRHIAGLFVALARELDVRDAWLFEGGA
jgi:hypothetical protein